MPARIRGSAGERATARNGDEAAAFFDQIVGQHGDADPQCFDRIEAARRGEKLGDLGEGLQARGGKAPVHLGLVPAALGVRSEQSRFATNGEDASERRMPVRRFNRGGRAF